MSHPMYNLVDSALKYAINRRSQRAAFWAVTETSMKDALRKIWIRMRKLEASRDKKMEEHMAAVRVQAAWRKKQGTYTSFVIKRALSQIEAEEKERMEEGNARAIVPLLRIDDDAANLDHSDTNSMTSWERDLLARALDDGSMTIRSLDSRDAVSLGSVADGMDDEDRAAFSCLEYDLLVMETGQMLRMGLFRRKWMPSLRAWKQCCMMN